MNFLYKQIVCFIPLMGLLFCMIIPVAAQDLEDGFYTSIYDRIKNEKEERVIQNVAKKMGLSEQDIITIAQGKSVDTVSDIQELALGGEVKGEEIKGMYDQLRARSKDNVPEILANYEKLVSKFAFEESLVELEIELEEEAKALEIFANGDADDVEFGADEKVLVEALNKINLVKQHVGEISESDLEDLISFDLIRDLSVIDLIIFGKGETKRLSPGGVSDFDFWGARGEPEEASATEEDVSDTSESPAGGTRVAGMSGIISDTGQSVSQGAGSSDGLPNSLNASLGAKDMHDPEISSPPDSQGRVVSSEGVLECSVGKSIDLDYSPEERLKMLERRKILGNIASLFPDGQVPDDVAGAIEDDTVGTSTSETRGIVAGMMGMTAIDSIGVNSDEILEAGEDDEYTEEECWTAEFDIIACYKLDAGTYGAPKTYQDDNCISCHVSEINKIFSDKLLPYGLKARKNEGLIGGGSYCNEANKMNVGLDIILVPKPLNFYKDVCYPDPDSGEEPPIDEPTRLMNEVQVNYLKAVYTLQDELDDLLLERNRLIAEKREASDNEKLNYEAAILQLDLSIYSKQDEILNLREKNQLILHEWRSLKEDYEEQTGCEYTIGSMKTDKFDKVLEEHDKELLKTVPSTHASETVNSVVAGRILSLEPENIAEVYNASEAGVLLRETRHEENKWISENENRMSDLATKTSLLAREIGEFTTHFRSFKQVMESLRNPEDSSVLKKLREKETP